MMDVAEQGWRKSSEQCKWYVLYTMSRREKQVEQCLKKLEVETYLPLHLSPRRWSDRIKLVELPLFPSYVFVKTTNHKLRSLLSVQGVAKIVFYNGIPAEIKESEVLAITLFLEKAQAKELTFCTNEDVMITYGPLKELSGKIKKIGKKRIELYLEQLNICVSVSLDNVFKKQLV